MKIRDDHASETTTRGEVDEKISGLSALFHLLVIGSQMFTARIQEAVTANICTFCEWHSMGTGLAWEM